MQTKTDAKPNLKRQAESSTHAVHSVSSTKKGLIWSLVLTGGFFIVELVVGWRINSVAVIADGFHNFSAAAGLGIALLAIIFIARPPSPERTFGFLKGEVLAAWLNAILLLIMAYIVADKGIKNFLSPSEPNILIMLILSVIGLIIGGIPAFLLYKKQKTDLNARGAFWHVMQTLLGSMAVLLAALTIKFTGWQQADAVFGMLLAPILVIASWSIIKESTRMLLDLTPKNLNLLEIKKDIESQLEVEGVHHMHAWALTTNKNIFSAHVKVTSDADKQKILINITKLLKTKYDIYFSTVQVETICLEEGSELKKIDFI